MIKFNFLFSGNVLFPWSNQGKDNLRPQRDVAQRYSLRIALIVNDVNESKIYFAVQLSVNELVSRG